MNQLSLKDLLIFSSESPARFTNDLIKDYATQSCQLLVSDLFKMETFVDDNGVFARLPASEYLLPRAKPVPSEKALTKWERFAKGKGILNRKKERYAFDDDKGEERPRYGYQSTKNDPLNTWLVEVPKGGDIMEDYIAKAGEPKKAKVEKNKKQQLKNQQGGLNKFHLATQSMDDKNNAKVLTFQRHLDSRRLR